MHCLLSPGSLSSVFVKLRLSDKGKGSLSSCACKMVAKSSHELRVLFSRWEGGGGIPITLLVVARPSHGCLKWITQHIPSSRWNLSPCVKARGLMHPLKIGRLFLGILCPFVIKHLPLKDKTLSWESN